MQVLAHNGNKKASSCSAVMNQNDSTVKIARDATQKHHMRQLTGGDTPQRQRHAGKGMLDSEDMG